MGCGCSAPAAAPAKAAKARRRRAAWGAVEDGGFEASVLRSLRHLRPAERLNGGPGEGRVLDEHGFWQPAGDEGLAGEALDALRASEVARVATGAWRSLLAGATPPARELEPYALAGLPPDLRGEAWAALLGATRAREANAPGTYEALLREPLADAAVRQIALDLPRTFPAHPFFAREGGEGQRALGRVLRAVALACPGTGYVQGMNFVGAIFLLQARDEAEAFWMAAAYMHRLGWARYYGDGDGMAQLLQSMELVGDAIAACLPGVRARFDELGMGAYMFAAPWFLSGFTYNLPAPDVIRLWDVMFLVGAAGAGAGEPPADVRVGGVRLALGALGPAVRADEFVVCFALAWTEHAALEHSLERLEFEDAQRVMTLQTLLGRPRVELRQELRRVCARALDIDFPRLAERAAAVRAARRGGKDAAVAPAPSPSPAPRLPVRALEV